MRKIDVKDIKDNVFSMMADEWFLITAGTKENCNTMTAGWGGLGVLWGEPAATIYVRPQRYTKEFLDREDSFTLCFFGEEYRKELVLCGNKSGRELDKIRECGFTLAETQAGAPMIEQARLVLVCRKWYAQDLDPAAMPEEVKQKWYPRQDYHTMYVGGIVEAYTKE